MLAMPISALASPPEGPVEAHTAAEPQPAPAPVIEFDRHGPHQPLDQAPVPRRNRGLGWTVFGFGMFGTSYLLAATVGAVVADSGDPYLGRPMLIPIVGPFIAGSRSPSTAQGFLMGSSGVFQAGGLAMGIVGAVMLGKARAANRRVALGGGGLVVRF